MNPTTANAQMATLLPKSTSATAAVFPVEPKSEASTKVKKQETKRGRAKVKSSGSNKRKTSHKRTKRVDYRSDSDSDWDSDTSDSDVDSDRKHRRHCKKRREQSPTHREVNIHIRHSGKVPAGFVFVPMPQGPSLDWANLKLAEAPSKAVVPAPPGDVVGEPGSAKAAPSRTR